MKRYLIFTCFCCLFLWGCPTEDSTTATYIIENTLDSNLKIQFFRSGTMTRTSLEQNGMGTVFQESVTELGNNVLPSSALRADSIVLFFDDEKFESHDLFNNPKGNSLLNQEDYQKEGHGVFRYSITEKNYNNATPCNGNCD